MENKEVILIAVLASITSLSMWYALRTSNPESQVLQSYYSILIFPPLFALLFIFLRNMIKSTYS
ncbi:MAG: hypothetical protein ACLFVL_06740 [Candidatus Aenigmatarchaeota archaeon]